MCIKLHPRDASFDSLVSFLSHFLLFALKKLMDLWSRVDFYTSNSGPFALPRSDFTVNRVTQSRYIEPKHANHVPRRFFLLYLYLPPSHRRYEMRDLLLDTNRTIETRTGKRYLLV